MKILQINDKKFSILNNQVFSKIGICLGLFDGIHEGHLFVFETLTKICETKNINKAVFTLSQNISDFNKNQNNFIYEQNQKIKFFKKQNFKYYFNYDVSKESIKLSYLNFMEILKNKMNVNHIVVGYDFRFGYKAKGSTNDLIDFFGTENVTILDFVKNKQGSKISSGNVKLLLKNNNILKANKILIEPIIHNSKVIQGKKLGQQIGYPTANQIIKSPYLFSYGIYITQTIIENQKYNSVSCYWKPHNNILLETYILDFDKNIYNKNITIKFLKFLRLGQAVSNIDQIKSLLEQDVKKTLCFLNKKCYY